MAHAGSSSMFRQPKAVWAVAFACVVSFMGIGLVDPILPVAADKLGGDARPRSSCCSPATWSSPRSPCSVTGWVSSRMGAKRTLDRRAGPHRDLLGAAGSSGIDRPDRRLPRRLGPGQRPVHRDLAGGHRRRRPRGGFAGAIILYETALGLGIASGPLVAGCSARISWRGPFFGVAVLMAIALLGHRRPPPADAEAGRPERIIEPLKALRHRSLATTSVDRLLYNWGFFTILGLRAVPRWCSHAAPARLGVLRLGCARRDLRGLGRPVAAAPASARAGTLYGKFVLWRPPLPRHRHLLPTTARS